MISRYFPKCNVVGPIEPVFPYTHLGANGAVPFKCIICFNLFEGECLRLKNSEYMELDHGPCPILGLAIPTKIEIPAFNDKNKNKTEIIQIPKKCAGCKYLRIKPINRVYCSYDSEKWGEFHRGLDWGDYNPL